MILPQPPAGFTWVGPPTRPALVCDALATIARHAFTTRSWRLGTASGTNAWREVADAVAVKPGHLSRARQIHGADVIVRRTLEPLNADTAADILLGNARATAVAIQTADCVPLLIGDARTGAVAAAHAGWRGTALGVAAVAVRAMGSELGSQPEDLVAAIGPAIGPCCYEVGEDVRQRFAREGYTADQLGQWFSTTASDLAANPPMPYAARAEPAAGIYLDLWTATRDQLESAGVRGDRIFASHLCTASHPGAFCSYRRDGKDAGRLAAVIRARDANT